MKSTNQKETIKGSKREATTFLPNFSTYPTSLSISIDFLTILMASTFTDGIFGAKFFRSKFVIRLDQISLIFSTIVTLTYSSYFSNIVSCFLSVWNPSSPTLFYVKGKWFLFFFSVTFVLFTLLLMRRPRAGQLKRENSKPIGPDKFSKSAV